MLAQNDSKSKKIADKTASTLTEHLSLKNTFRVIIGLLGGHLGLYIYENYNYMNFQDVQYYTALSHLVLIILLILVGELTPLLTNFVAKTIELWFQATNPLRTSIQKEIDREKELVDKITALIPKQFDLVVQAIEKHLESTKSTILNDHTKHIEMVFSQSLSHIEEAMAKLEELGNKENITALDERILALEEELKKLKNS